MDNAEFKNFRRIWTVSATLPINFTIEYSSDIFNPSNHDLISCADSKRRIVVVDQNVFNIYGSKIEKYFSTLKTELLLHVVDASESNKNWESVDEILQFFERSGILRRSDPVIAIGGGVLLDLVGFCASVYRRGIPYIKVPTTLLSIVDASIGVKVGANHLSRRNRIGAYYPPVVSLLDKKFIASQSLDEIVNGMAEIFKLALIKDAKLFDLLSTNGDQLINEKFQYGAVPVKVINLAIEGMLEELEPNLWEKKLDRCVDFGHSFSPIIEMKNVETMSHGRAVVLDCLLSSCIAHAKKLIDLPTLNRIFSTATHLKLMTFHEDFTNIELLTQALNDTMKHRNGNQYLPLPISIGNYIIANDVSAEEIQEGVRLFRSMQ